MGLLGWYGSSDYKGVCPLSFLGDVLIEVKIWQHIEYLQKSDYILLKRLDGNFGSGITSENYRNSGFITLELTALNI